MVLSPLLETLAHEHPALVHLPLGLVLVLPVALIGAQLAREPRPWLDLARFLGVVAWLGGLVALLSGLLWARQLNLLPAGGLLPALGPATQALPRLLWRHEATCVAGLVLGLLFLLLLRKAARPLPRAAALALGLGWAWIWGFAGHLGGTMVFGNEELNRAAAAADAARRNDLEADLPVRALDYASLEPARARPFRSPAHGGHWAQVWVTASGESAYRAGRPLPVGAYAVLSTRLDEAGRPGPEPGPLLMRETRRDGGQSFSYYWPRVPENLRAATGGEDSVYWRSPAPQLQTCAGCHSGTAP
jgi:uncharacterized membrane protein